ncbi:MAG: hypothetical protein ACI9CF_001395 [Candidatus Omnitrophota bacterium]|jgi:hypothetical protein
MRGLCGLEYAEIAASQLRASRNDRLNVFASRNDGERLPFPP